jgi:NAD(P)-dependent dehydrogenase (short-subunit alcohol dehydrogenase family)
VPRFDGKVAVVTGAGQGHGRVVAQRLAREGASVLAADIIEETVEAVAEQINKDGGKAIVAVADLTEYDQAERAVGQAISHFGQVDILCNVAGIGPRGHFPNAGKKFWQMTPDEWEGDIRHNLYTCLNCCRAVTEHMMERRHGKILNWGTAKILVGVEGSSIMHAAKGAIYTFTKCLALELAPYNINVNQLDSYLALADMETRPPMAHLPPEEREAWLASRIKTIPLGRMGTGEEIAELAAFLVSDGASWITGQSICISGGAAVR